MNMPQFPSLSGFRSGYFNQDWLDDYEDETALIDDFLGNASPSTVANVRGELRTLLASIPADQLTEEFLFQELGCYGGPAEGQSVADWLSGMLAQMDNR